jgi:hypothetical protein
LFLPRINNEHGAIDTFTIIISRESELTRQQGKFLVIKMPFQLQFYALPARVVIQVPDAVAEAGS